MSVVQRVKGYVRQGGAQARRHAGAALRAPGRCRPRARRAHPAAHRPVRRGGRSGRGARSAAGRARRAGRAVARRAARAALASVTRHLRCERAGAGTLRRPGDAEREPPRSRRRPLHGRARGRAVARAPAARAQLLAQSRSPAARGRSSRSSRAGGSCTATASSSVHARRRARLLHVVSPFELDVPISRLWPAAAATRGLRLVVTLYDLIPEIFPERYLADPGLRRRYRARLELVRAADTILAISETTARDAVEPLARARRPHRRGGRGRGRDVRAAGTVGKRSAGRGARRGSRARGAVRALHRGHGRPEELPRAVPRVVGACRRPCATRGSS